MDMVPTPEPSYSSTPGNLELTSSTHSIVISCFAIVILSAIGSMFANGNHSLMGSTEDPKDGKKVAATVFGAVIVYAVCVHLSYSRSTLGTERVVLKRAITMCASMLTGVCVVQIFLLFCASQAFLHARRHRQGEIALR